MFKPLLNDLHKVYTGDVIYLPEYVYDLVKKWMESTMNAGRSLGRYQTLSWKGKLLKPIDEELLMAAYQSTPIHVPERILEKSIVIETSLEPKPVEPVREEVVKPKPKPQTVRYGRREGTKSKSFNELF